MTMHSVETAELVLAQEHLEFVCQVLREHAPHHRAYAFGSRVVRDTRDRARLKPHSDLDLALEGPELSPQQLFALREAFSESDLPMRVDLVEAVDLPAGWNIRALRL